MARILLRPFRVPKLNHDLPPHLRRREPPPPARAELPLEVPLEPPPDPPVSADREPRPSEPFLRRG